MPRLTTALVAVVLACCLAAGCGGKRNAHSRVTSPKPVAPNPPAQQAAPTPFESGSDPYVVNPPVTGKMGEELASAAERIRPEGIPAGHPILKRWPRQIEWAAISPNRGTIALYDGTGAFLTNPRGGQIRRLPLALKEDLASGPVIVGFAFRSDGRRVAVLTTSVSGEPTGFFVERLWTADAATGRYRRVREWAGRVQGQGPQTAERELNGWSKDGRSVVVSGTVYDGIDMPSDAKVVGTERVLVRDKAL